MSWKAAVQRITSSLRPAGPLPLILLTLLATGCQEDCTRPEPLILAGQFAGSASCAPCHQEIHGVWLESGHPYGLVRAAGAAPVGAFPALSAFAGDPVDPPGEHTWSAISYVGGGYGWKMLWMDRDGFVVTSGEEMDPVQYCFADRSWTSYGCGFEPGTKPADCGRCHATGWTADLDASTDGDLSDNQDGLPGMSGTFFAPGVHCEECHGAGRAHARDPEGFGLVVDRSSADCGRCHLRDDLNRVQAFARFILPNGQYDEWRHSGHSILGRVECVDCHDPHASVKFDAVAAGSGTLVCCEECHSEAAAHNGHDVHAVVACVDCHMPRAVKSAVARQDYAADMRTHLMDIDPAPRGRAEGMGLVGGNVSVLQDPSTGLCRITLDFACYGCHGDGEGRGGEEVPLDLAELAALATGIHDPPPPGGGILGDRDGR